MGLAIRVEKLGKNAPLVVIGVRMKFRVVRHDYIHHLTAIRAYKSFVPLPYGVNSRWGWNLIFQVQGVAMIFAVHLVLGSSAGVIEPKKCFLQPFLDNLGNGCLRG